jgi:Lrp/AsnC family leucine-responsive transcriptional regulator
MAREGLDDNDRAIIRELLRDSGRSLKALSERTGLLMASLSKRIARLRNIGVIERFTLNIDHVRAGLPVMAFLLIQIRVVREFDEYVKKTPSVVEAYKLFGRYDYCLKIICESTDVLMEITQDILSIEGVERGETIIVAKPIKNEHSELFSVAAN